MSHKILYLQVKLVCFLLGIYLSMLRKFKIIKSLILIFNELQCDTTHSSQPSLMIIYSVGASSSLILLNYINCGSTGPWMPGIR